MTLPISYQNTAGTTVSAEAITATDTAVQTGTVSAGTTNITGNMKIRKQLDIANLILSVKPSSALTSGTEYTIGVLPEGFRPINALSSLPATNGQFQLLVSGEIKFTPSANISTSTWISLTATYIAY